MNKLVVVINGKGEVGKDTLCSFVAKKYKVMNVSSIDPIKDAAKRLGWKGQKDNKSRKLLSDLKRISIEFNDFPNIYLSHKYNQFVNSNYEVLFVHIREKEQINHFTQTLGINVVTLLIRRKISVYAYGNISDDNVEEYDYDYVYNNDKPLAETANDFLDFFDEIFRCHVNNYESKV